MDVMKIFKFSYSWLFDSRSLKWYAFILVLPIVLVLAAVALGASGYFVTSRDGGAPVESLLGWMIIPLVGIVMIYLLAVVYVSARIAMNALSSKNIPTEPFEFDRFLSYLWLCVLCALYAVFSWYDKRFSFVFVGGLALLVIAAAVPFALGNTPTAETIKAVFPVIALPFLVIGAIVVAYNGIRLGFAIPIFLSKKFEKTSDALRESWDMTKGHVIEIFVTSLACGIIWVIIMAVLGVIPLVNFLVAPFGSFYSEYIMVGIYSEVSGVGKEGE